MDLLYSNDFWPLSVGSGLDIASSMLTDFDLRSLFFKFHVSSIAIFSILTEVLNLILASQPMEMSHRIQTPNFHLPGNPASLQNSQSLQLSLY